MNPTKTIAIFVLLLLTVAARAQENLPPVEIRYDDFFNQSSLKALTFGDSTEDDVVNIFGSNCESGCEFDERWKVKFKYFGVVEMSKLVGDKWNTYLPNRDYWAKLYEIQFLPRQRLAFGRYKVINRSGLDESYQVSYSFESECSPRLLSFDMSVFDKCELESISFKVSAELEEKMFILQSSRPYDSRSQEQ